MDEWKPEEDTELVRRIAQGMPLPLGNRTVSACMTRMGRLTRRGICAERWRIRKPASSDDGARVPWARAEEEAARRLLAWGIRWPDLAKVLGRTEAAVRQRAAVNLWRAALPWTKADVERAKEMISSGATLRDAALCLGRTPKALARKLERDRGIGL